MLASDDEHDRRFMALAHSLGRRALGQAWPNPAVGAVLVREIDGDQIIVGRGWTQKGGRPHAEVEALARAGAAARGATAYVTLEPCSHHGKTPPCAEALIAAGVARVVAAIEDANPKVAGQGHARLRAAGVAVRVGVLSEEARRAHAGHFRLVREGRPQVMLKLAVSADGKIGLSGRRPAAITGEKTRTRVHLLRAMHDAILIGVGTALSDDPLLTCRLPGMEGRSPVRVVLDAALRLPLGSRLIKTAGTTPLWIIASPDASGEAEAKFRALGVEVLRVEAPDGRIDLAQALHRLGGRGITRLMVEGGARIATSFTAAGLIDEATIFHSPRTIGPDGIDALEGLPLTALTAALNPCGTEAVGEDRVELFERV